MTDQIRNAPGHRVSQGERYLSFSLGQETYLMPLLAVKEVIGMPDVTPIPGTPSYYRGLMNLRGQVIPVFDLRTKLGIAPRAGGETAVIICDLISFCLGVIVDSIDAVAAPEETEISERPMLQNGRDTDYVTGVFRRDKQLALLIDLAKALSMDDLRAVAASTQKPVAA